MGTNIITLKSTKVGTFTISLTGSSSTTIDFGNGTTKVITLTSTLQNISITFSDSSEKTILIDNASNIVTFDCNSMNINLCDISACSNLSKLICYNNNIQTLDFSLNKSIQYIHCFNNPIVTNDFNLQAMIESLPDRNSMPYGSIIIDNRVQMLKVEPISIKKDWLFGSAIMYNATEWTKCGYHFKQLGIADIWESGDQGEGVTISLIDCGFDLRCQEYSSNSIVGVRNFSNQGTVDQVPLPTSGNTVHGNGTSSLIIAKGINMYGIAPKAKLLLLKVSGADNICYTSWVTNAINYSNNQSIDLISISLGFTSNNSTLQKSVNNFCLSNSKTNYIGRPFVSAAGNSGDGNPSTNEFTYPGGYDSAITVGAINSSNTLWTSSSSYPGIDLVSYGVSVTMQGAYNGYKTGSGTSYSTPMTAGVLALLYIIFFKKNGRKPTESELYKELIKRTISINKDVREMGVGRLQLMSYNSNPNQIAHT